MTRARSLAALLATLAFTLTPACVGKPTVEPSRPGETLVVLLKDSDTGSTGRVQVSNPSGSIDLANDRESTAATANQAPGAVVTLSEAEVARLFGDVLATLPPPAQSFTLYFRFESDELTDESKALLRDVISAVNKRSAPEVVVVGHTDTMGAAPTNAALGLKRAATVRKLLTDAGLDASLIGVSSHGEGDPLIRTADNTPEPRNRRVEIGVR
jgi:outer membrane protein OmpA-like peptidoglycan-associated protein